jgi:hypothetical protein
MIKFLKLMTIVHLIAMMYPLQVVVPGFSPDTQDVPIDGGICLLMAAGIGYGIKKTKNQDTQLKK